MKTLWQRSGFTRTPPLPPLTIEGIVLREPMEQHSHSRWMALRTDEGHLVRFMVANSAPVTNWIEPGQTVRVCGWMSLKPWADGPHETLSAHESIEILAGDLRVKSEGRPQ